MTKLSQVMHHLDRTGHGQGVAPVFITVDPERDDVATLKKYLAFFDVRLVNLTGSRTELQRVAASFKTFMEADTPAEGGNDSIAHCSIMYVVDPFGRIVGHILFGAGPEVVSARVTEFNF